MQGRHLSRHHLHRVHQTFNGLAILNFLFLHLSKLENRINFFIYYQANQKRKEVCYQIEKMLANYSLFNWIFALILSTLTFPFLNSITFPLHT